MMSMAVTHTTSKLGSPKRVPAGASWGVLSYVFPYERGKMREDANAHSGENETDHHIYGYVLEVQLPFSDGYLMKTAVAIP